MRRDKYIIFFLLIFLMGFIAEAGQAQTIKKDPLLKINGYLKELGTLSFDNKLQTFHYDNLIHNRINSKWTFTPHWSAQADLRTRLFNGYSVRNVPEFANVTGQDQGLVDLSWNVINSPNILLNTQIDRLYTTYYTKKWELDVGRQRINWGRTLVWNPNDLFNTYSYLDFDYEERPGADAIRFQYFTGFASGYEVAFKPDRNMKNSVGAFLAKQHYGQYDVQGLAGYYRDMLAVGGGWAGPIGKAGFKGEWTYFQPFQKKKSGYLVATTSVDYSFKSSLYLYGEFLYNGNWHKNNNPALILSGSLSPNNLFIAQTALFAEAQYQLNPLLKGTLAGITSMTQHLFIFIPQISYSVTNNIDFLLLAQILRNNPLEQILNTPNILYARLKWSF